MTIHQELTVGELVAKHYQSAAVFNRYGIDFCCGGKKTLGAVCTEKTVDFDALSNDLRQAFEVPDLPSQNPYNWAPDFLVEYIEQTHHRYLREALPFVLQYTAKIAQVHGARHPELKVVHKQLEDLAQELLQHLAKEEQILFPYVKTLYESLKPNQPAARAPFGTVKNPIRMMEDEHENAGAILDNLRELTNNFTPPEDACASYIVTFAKLDELDRDLRRHIHLENNILFPRAIFLEQSMKGLLVSG